MCKTTVTENCGTHLSDSGKLNHLNFQKRSFRYFLALLPVAVILLISTSYQQNFNESNYIQQEYYSPEIIDSLRHFVELTDGTTLISDSESIASSEFLHSFYSQFGYRPAWVHFGGVSDRAIQLIALIEHAREWGLEPQNYHISAIRSLLKQAQLHSTTQNYIDFNLEILLTDAAFRMMVNLNSGYVAFDSAIWENNRIKKFPDLLQEGLMTGKITQYILSVEPSFIEYSRLRKANAIFVKSNVISENQVLINYPTRDTVLLMSQIAEALNAEGYMQNKNADVKAALKVFQRFNGLTPDGKPGINTIEALEKSNLYRYRVLALNLDRLRKKQFSTDSVMLYVNIPAYRLKIVNHNEIKDTFRVIVGNPKTPTPLLYGKMERIIANPMWYVPRSITINEILPKIKSDSNYLSRNNFKLLDRNNNLVNAKSIDIAAMDASDFDYTVRQNRGSDNSLGQVKFIFSNPYSVYLHDTPGKTLFYKDLRAFSHGCVRVHKPERLANYILHEINADSTNFSRLMNNGQHREFSVNSPLSVLFTYITCEADETGHVYFYKDIYNIDAKELEKLTAYFGI